MCGCGGCPRPRRLLEIDEVMVVVPDMMARLQQVSDFKGKEGGMFYLLDQAGNVLVEPTAIGKVAEDKLAKYTELCQEKASRLRQRRLDGHEEWQSWESRDAENGKWGGAIFDGRYYWSFSGLTEEQDEALMVMSAHMCGQMMNGSPEVYAKTSDNRVILDNEGLFWSFPIVSSDEPELSK